MAGGRPVVAGVSVPLRWILELPRPVVPLVREPVRAMKGFHDGAPFTDEAEKEEREIGIAGEEAVFAAFLQRNGSVFVQHQQRVTVGPEPELFSVGLVYVPA